VRSSYLPAGSASHALCLATNASLFDIAADGGYRVSP
jgi:hypothetical protein